MADTKVIVRSNGPYRLEGDNIVITDQDGNVFKLSGRTVVSTKVVPELVVPTGVNDPGQGQSRQSPGQR